MSLAEKSNQVFLPGGATNSQNSPYISILPLDQQHLLLKIRKKTIWNYNFQVACSLSLPLLNIQNCHSVLKFLSMHFKLFIYA